MKKFLSIIIILLFIIANISLQATAGNSSKKITINNKTFKLKFAKCAEEHNMCINEYYLPNEKNWQWSELITIHYYGKVQDEKAYAQHLVNSTKYAEIIDSTDSYTIFTSLHPYNSDEKLYVEQDVFKAEKSKTSSGIKMIQYGTRYPYYNKDIATQSDSKMRKTQNDYSLILKHIQIPEIVKANFQMW